MECLVKGYSTNQGIPTGMSYLFDYTEQTFI